MCGLSARYAELAENVELGEGRGPRPARSSTLSFDANDFASSARVWRYAYSRIARRASKLDVLQSLAYE